MDKNTLIYSTFALLGASAILYVLSREDGN
jgi:hypothetical protein